MMKAAFCGDNIGALREMQESLDRRGTYKDAFLVHTVQNEKVIL